MSEDDVREALLAVDREEVRVSVGNDLDAASPSTPSETVSRRRRSTQVKGLTDPKVTIKGSSWMTQSARNAKFMTGCIL